MTQNIFAAQDQAELNAIIHRPKDNCPGDCEWCKKFHRASVSVKAAAAKGFEITLTRNEQKVESDGYFLVWCKACSDGENGNFYDSCDWGQNHAVKRHSS